MNEQKQHQVQQDAFMWFKSTYGKTPQEFGIKEIVPRIKTICFFLKCPQIVFALEQNAAAAFIKVQTIIEFLINSTIIFVPLIAGSFWVMLVFLLQGKIFTAYTIGGVIVFCCILAITALIVCYKKLKPLEKLYKNKVIVYTA